MDSKIVSREIRACIWPELKKVGFSNFSTRTAWRHQSHKIDVVNFQSFNSYLAEGIGATTFSYSLNLGFYLPYIPTHRVKQKDGKLFPEEYCCHFRRRLLRTFPQPELDRVDTWFIGKNGEYLAESIADALEQIRSAGLPWFQRFEAPEEVLRTLLEDEGGETRGLGTRNSPVRLTNLAYTYLHLGNRAAARNYLSEDLTVTGEVLALLRASLQEGPELL